MVVSGMRWCSIYGNWELKWVQVEFLDGSTKRFIAVSEYDLDWTILISNEDLFDSIMKEELDPQDHGAIHGELLEILPAIIKSPHSADICFAMKALTHFPGSQRKDQWENVASAYIKEFIGKDSSEVL